MICKYSLNFGNKAQNFLENLLRLVDQVSLHLYKKPMLSQAWPTTIVRWNEWARRILCIGCLVDEPDHGLGGRSEVLWRVVDDVTQINASNAFTILGMDKNSKLKNISFSLIIFLLLMVKHNRYFFYTISQLLSKLFNFPILFKCWQFFCQLHCLVARPSIDR